MNNLPENYLQLPKDVGIQTYTFKSKEICMYINHNIAVIGLTG